jgi:hypothetical protein
MQSVKLCRSCNRTLSLSMFPKCRSTRTGVGSWCKECNRKRNNIRNRANRVKVLDHYSGGEARCACCGIDKLEFLSLDHINGGGRQQRRTIKIRWWEWIIKNGYPQGFRVLCHNCNQSIGLYGYCPHSTFKSLLREAFESYDPNAPNKSYKLSQENVDAIRSAIANGVAQIELAARYNVSRALICCINKGKRWADG